MTSSFPTQTVFLAVALAASVALVVPPLAAADEPPQAAEEQSRSAERPSSESAAAEAEEPLEPPIEIIEAIRPSAEDTAAMKAWHRLYVERFEPLKKTWLKLLEALATADRDRIEPLCQELSNRLAKLEIETFLPAPDPAVDLYLKRTIADLGRVEPSCRAGRWFEMSHRLEKARASFVETTAMIRRYGLEP